MLRRTVLTKEPPVQTPEYKKAFWDKLHEGNHVTVILKDGDVVDEHENVRVLKNDAGVLCATINKRLVPFGDTFYRLLPATKSSEATQRMDRTEALDYAAAKNGDGRLSYALCDDLTSFFSVYTTNVSEEASVLTLFYYTRTGFYWFSESFLVEGRLNTTMHALSLSLMCQRHNEWVSHEASSLSTHASSENTNQARNAWSQLTHANNGKAMKPSQSTRADNYANKQTQ